MLKLDDLKNVDINKLIVGLSGRKDVLGQAFVIVAALVIAASMVNDYFKQKADYQQQTQTLDEKLQTIESYNESQKKIQTFFEGLPQPLEDERFASQVQEYAQQANVTILSFLPGDKLARTFTDILSADITLQAASYKDFLNFLSTLEKSPFALRVDACSVKEGEKKAIEAHMQLTLVSLKK